MSINRNWPLLALPVAVAIAAVPYLHAPERGLAALDRSGSQHQTAQTAQNPTTQGATPSTPQAGTPGTGSTRNSGTQDSGSQDSGSQNLGNPWQSGTPFASSDRGGSGGFGDQDSDPLTQQPDAQQPDAQQNDPSGDSGAQDAAPYASAPQGGSTDSTGSGSSAGRALRSVYDSATRSAVRVNVGDSGTGSGSFISADGLILTAAHVALAVPGAALTVTTDDGQDHPASLVGYDEVRDLAVLKIQGNAYPALPLAGGSLRVGDAVVAIGNSRGTFDGGRAGRVTALNASLDPTFPSRMVASSMPLAPGDSGGPVLNARGQLVGVSTAIATKEGQFSSYFVPVTSGSSLLSQLEGGVRRGVPVLGISVEDAQQQGGVPGALVTAVSPGLGAARSGLRAASTREFRDDSGAVQRQAVGGDVIVGVDGHPVTSPSQLVGYLRSKQVGDRVTLRVQNGGRARSVTVTLSARPQTQG